MAVEQVRYGLPYMGSKNKIAKRIVDALPRADALVDLFAGGGAITHRALEVGKYARVLMNDHDASVMNLFVDAVNGKYRNEKRWISHEEYVAERQDDAYVRLCWSFGNKNQKKCNYLYSREIEPWKKALHYARVFGDYSLLREFGIDSDGSRDDIKAHAEEYKRRYIKWFLGQRGYTDEEQERLLALKREDIERDSEELRLMLCDALEKSGLTQAEVGRRLGTQMQGHYFGKSQWQFPTKEHYERMREFLPLPTPYDELVGLRRLSDALESLQRLQSLESLQRLERLQRLEGLPALDKVNAGYVVAASERLEVLSTDYRNVEVPRGAVVYCDIPYEGTEVYGNGDFSHKEFHEWAATREFPLYVSSYTLPSDLYDCVGEFKQECALGGQGSKSVKERLFVPKCQRAAHDRRECRQLDIEF